MKPSTIKQIQKQLGAFLPTIIAIMACYKHTLALYLVNQLVSNAAGDTSRCVDVNDEDRENTIINLRNALDKLNKYNERNLSLNYICQECIMIIDGKEMNEDNDMFQPFEDDRNGGNSTYGNIPSSPCEECNGVDGHFCNCSKFVK